DPEAVAVVCADKDMSFRELEERANELAHLLIEAGVHAETAVGVLLEPSLELVVCLLGILKSGAAYVPLDVSDSDAPGVHGAGSKVILTRERGEPGLPRGVARVVCLDREDFTRFPKDTPHVKVHPEQSAYAAYVSSPAEQPDAVCGTQENLRYRV